MFKLYMGIKSYDCVAVFTLFLIVVNGQLEEYNDKIVDQIAFLETYAEKWAFNHIFRAKIPEYLERVQAHMTEKIKSHNDVPNYEDKISVKIPNGKLVYLNLTLHEGKFKAEAALRLKFNELLAYDGLDAVYSIEAHWENLTVQHGFRIMKNKKGYKGEVSGFSSGLRTMFKVRQNLSKDKPSIESIISHCCGEINVAVKGIPSDRKLVTEEIQRIVLNHYRGIIAGDKVALFRMALIDSLSRIESKSYIPKYFKKDDLPPGVHSPFKMSKCQSVTGPSQKSGVTRPEEITIGNFTNLPFLINDVERRVFETQMRKNIELYSEEIVSQAMTELSDRGLTDIKVKGLTKDFSFNVPMQQVFKGQIAFGNGHITGGVDFRKDKITELDCSYDKCLLSWRIKLPGILELVHNYRIQMGGQQYHGETTTWPRELAFTIRMELSFKNMSSNLLAFNEECFGEIVLHIDEDTEIHQLALQSHQEELSTLIAKNLEDVKYLLTQAFSKAISTIKLRGYLPNWNYERESMAQPSRMSISGNISFCSLEELIYSEDKEFGQRGPASIEYDKRLPFLMNAYHDRAFEVYFKDHLEYYLKAALNEANNIIQLRGVNTFAIPGKQRYQLTKGPLATVQFLNCSVDDITPFLVQEKFIDKILHENNYLELQFKSTLWRNLKVRCLYEAEAQEIVSNGNIDGDLQDVIYNIRIRIQSSADSGHWSLGGAELQTFKLACVGNLVTQITPSGNSDDQIKILFNSTVIDALKVSEDLFIHAIEDAIQRVDASKFSPNWDYTTIAVTSEKLSGVKFTKCSEAHDIKWSLGDLPAEVKAKGLEHYVRENLSGWVKDMTKSVFKMARDAIDKIFYPYWRRDPQIEEEHEITVAGKTRSKLTIVLKKRRINGMRAPNAELKSNISQINGNVITILATENFKEVEVDHSVEIYNPNDDTLPKNAVTGTIKMEVSDLKIDWKLYLNLVTGVMKFGSIQSACAREISGPKIKAKIPDLNNTVMAASDVMRRIVQEDALMAILEVMVEKLDRIASTYKPSIWVFPHWLWKGQTKVISDNGIRKKLLEEAIHFSGKDSCKEKSLANKQSLHHEDADRRLLNRLIRSAEGKFRTISSWFTKLYDLGRLGIQKHLIRSTLKDSLTFSVSSGIIEALRFDDTYNTENYTFNENGIMFESRLVNTRSVKFQADGEGYLPDGNKITRIEGSLQSLVYVYHLYFDRNKKRVQLMDTSLYCMGGIRVDLVPSTVKYEEYMKDFAKKLIYGPILDNIEDLLSRNLIAAVDEINDSDVVKDLFPEWNIEKYGYSQRDIEKYCSLNNE